MVSIITPAYNASKYLAETIESIIAQSYRDWEMIIVDDRSTDNTPDIVIKYERKDKRIRLLTTKSNGGAAVARNVGIDAARGDFIAFIDSDDIWHKEKLTIQLKKMEESRALFSFTAYNMVSKDKEIIKSISVPKRINYFRLLKGCNIGCSTVVYNAHVLGKHFFPPSFYAREDYVLWLYFSKSLLEDSPMLAIPEILASYRKHDGGISSKKSLAARNQWLVYREIEKLGFFSSLYYFTLYALNGVYKHYL